MADEGTAVRVVALRGGDGLARRMTEMGLNVGSELTVRQRQGSGIVVTRGEARFALGSAMAHKVLVERLEVVAEGDDGGTGICKPCTMDSCSGASNDSEGPAGR